MPCRQDRPLQPPNAWDEDQPHSSQEWGFFMGMITSPQMRVMMLSIPGQRGKTCDSSRAGTAVLDVGTVLPNHRKSSRPPTIRVSQVTAIAATS